MRNPDLTTKPAPSGAFMNSPGQEVPWLRDRSCLAVLATGLPPVSGSRMEIRANPLATEPAEDQILGMSLRYSIDARLCRIRIVAEGKLAPKDYEDFFRSFSTEGVEGVLDCLSDYRGIELSATGDDMRAIARILGTNASFFRGRNAVVVPNQASYGMARMFEALVDPYGLEVRIFERIEDAEAYLDQHVVGDD